MRLLVPALVAFGGCSAGNGDRPAAERPVVVVSVPPQAEFVERLAGASVELVVLIPPGASPATYEPTMRQLAAMDRAALYVKVGHPGFPFERTWLDRLLEGHDDLVVFDCSAHVGQQAADPHIWVSPPAMRAMVPHLAATLARLLPSERDAIAEREAALLAGIDALDADIRAALAGLEHRRFYVFHPAWGAFAAAYGLEQVSIEHDHKEPNAHQLTGLLERARADGVRVVFVQPQFSRRSAEVVAGEIGARVVSIDPLARDWAENLRRVTAALVEALGDR
ncbi:MAG: zinc ABC transporter substrate-binding protein [Candidatus Eiseniibacteriota bacterium]|jgi:zinc transport system substrate-binding protein